MSNLIETANGCKNCNGPCPEHNNFCSWRCHIELAKKNGGVVHTPNGLPILCITNNNMMVECEHGDHTDYKFPVIAEYFGKVNTEKEDHDISDHNLTLALIYNDDSIALTIYECSYIIWAITGRLIRGPDWLGKSFRLSEKSITDIMVGKYHKP